jgi:hypothetical protein|tara:strand:- start:1743 stop:2573 length:831 start_codon:yes stop_codon:yes gene_type:complete
VKFGLFTHNGALNSKPVFEAFANGVAHLGHEVVYNDINADVAVIWSVLWHGRMSANKNVWDTFIKQNKKVIVLEVGALFRGTTWKVGINGINKDATFPKGNNNSDRATQFGLELKPWNTDGSKIVICTQHDKSEQWTNMPTINQWVGNMVNDIRAYTDKEIIIRPHPRCKINIPGVRTIIPKQIPGTYDDFDLEFDDVYAVVNWSSNPATQAVMAGIPVYTGPSSLAWDVSIKDLQNINDPKLHDRTQWLNNLAYTEWSVPEISQGIPIKHLTSEL